MCCLSTSRRRESFSKQAQLWLGMRATEPIVIGEGTEAAYVLKATNK
jgi:hypothetical protein